MPYKYLLRIPDVLGTRVKTLAAQEGVSINLWLATVVAMATGKGDKVMPLQLNTDPASSLPKRVVWDPYSPEQTEEAKQEIQKLLNQGYRPLDDGAGEIVLVPPDGDPNKVVMRILDETGDSRLVWDRHQPAEVADARAKFDELIKQGHRAYVCRSDGTKGRKVETFEALLEEVILLDKQAAEKHDTAMGWREKPAEVVMVPKTQPG